MIAPSVKLIKAGREWKACCPFHKEKTPSFTVNDDKGFYHCFGCGAHGDAIRFLTDARGMPFMDAVKELAAKAGMEVPAPDPRATASRPSAPSTLTDVMAAVAGMVRRAAAGHRRRRRPRLSQAAAASTPRPSRASASASRPTAAAASSRRSQSLGEDKLIETGMLIQPEDGGKDSYDRFRGRLMFPIRDAARPGDRASAAASSATASPNI